MLTGYIILELEKRRKRERMGEERKMKFEWLSLEDTNVWKIRCSLQEAES